MFSLIRVVVFAWLSFAALCAPAQAQAQAQAVYPTREVKLVAGFAAGGATDTIARYYAKKNV
jgi:tripartite-type tricarboxylate transporter receptor subunit TctC